MSSSKSRKSHKFESKSDGRERNGASVIISETSSIKSLNFNGNLKQPFQESVLHRVNISGIEAEVTTTPNQIERKADHSNYLLS